ncbi:hypothetical protein [Nocardioides albus]|uniref:Uncharacterized protein n=1 Tax=Nocardioides albus TaxID=1841 RepID=A0A7W5F8L0_9ACTN|nr:hypothetical protein [Nocardioides albus]MBB3089171.1 hypothetical protein [Nocardioides albus]GGU13794.1 hypothetical protein GCM10007979_10150 [Nocardioides albus]
MTATAEKPDRVGLSVVAAVVVIAAEIVRLVILSQIRWELGYPEEYAVEGVLFTFVYLTYAAMLIWRGRSIVRKLLAPLLLVPSWLFDCYWLVADFLQARGSFDLPLGEWWLWVVRFLVVFITVCLVAAWGVARRRGVLWLLGLVVPVLLTIAWLKWSWRLYEALAGEIFVYDLIAVVPTVVITLLGCLACWGVEALTHRRA